MAKFAVLADGKAYELEADSIEYEPGGISTLKAEDGSVIAVIRGGTVLPAGSEVVPAAAE